MVRLTQNSFLGGQLDFELMGRQDFSRYAKGASKLRNFNVMKRGGLQKRQGFDRICDLKALCGISATDDVRLVPFAHKKTQGFVLILTGLKMYVVGTNPKNIYKIYSVSGGSGVYASDEIGELDYQQCGDVLFLAHQNHPPAKLSHYIDESGEDGFVYERLDLNGLNSGKPSISNATVKRTGVKCTGGTNVEHYKATAVFDGVETFPCDDFFNTNCGGNTTDTTSWIGTGYYMPWTESQTITLSVMPSVKYDDEGMIQYPEELRIYKKAFDYYGLVGTVKLDLKNVGVSGSSLATAGATVLKNSDATADTDLCDVSDDTAIPVSGNGRTAYVFDVGETYALTLGKSLKSAIMTLHLGSVYYTIDDDNTSVTFHYKGWLATGIKYSLGSGVTKTATFPSSPADKSETVDRDDGETDEGFSERWRNLYARFVNGCPDDPSVVIAPAATVTSTAVKIMFIGPVGGYVTLNRVVPQAVATISPVSFVDAYITPSTSITPPEDDGEEIFANVGDYPAAVSMSQQRLVWASTKNDPARIWMSQIGDFYTYSSHEIQAPDDPIDFIMPVTRFAKINHIAEMRKLLMFNSACEWLVDSASTSSGITYETIQAYPQSYSGSNERLKPIVCNNSLLFSERTGQTVRRFAYDLSNDGFAGKDVSVLAYSIFENNPIVDWTYQQFPFSTLWCALADGTFASFEFMEEQDILAWATHSLGGGGKVKAMATSYGVAPALDLVEDTDAYAKASHEEVFAVVVRGDDVWLERMRVKSEAEDSVYHSLCLDSVRVLNSLNHYVPGTDANLTFIPKNTSDGKPITRAEAVARLADGEEVYEGYAFDAEFVSCFPVIAPLDQSAVGVGQIDIKNVQNVAVRLAPSYGGTVRSWNFGKTDGHEERIRYDDNPANDCSAEFGGDGTAKFHECDCPNVKPDGMNTRDGRVYIRQGDPWPFGILMYELDIEPETGGWNGRS